MASDRLSGSRKTKCEVLSANRTILSSIEGQYRGPTPSICPPYMAERSRFSRIMSWVFSFVWVIPHEIWRVKGALFIKENSVGSSSPGCESSTSQLIVFPFNRGGVPVFRRPRERSKLSMRSASFTEGSSPIRPPGRDTSPIWMTPRRKVPVVRTTECADISDPSARITPRTAWSCIKKSVASPSTIVRCGVASISASMVSR